MKTITKGTKAKATRKRQPKKTSNRFRPNKAYIAKMLEFRGFQTGAEKTSLATLSVKNAMQRVNNIAMNEESDVKFTGAENAELQFLAKEFARKVNEIVDNK